MNKAQIAEINMFQTTALILTAPANKPITAGLPAFVRAMTGLEGSLNLLSALAQMQDTPLTGIALDKSRLQRSLINRTLIVAGAAGAYAFEFPNLTLGAKFDVKEGELNNTKDAMLDKVAQGIYDEAAAIIAADPVKTAEYNLKPTLLTDLQSAITAYSSTLGTPRAAIVGRVAVTEAITAEIDRAKDNLTNVLDRLILQFQAEHPAFVSAYEAARKVIRTGTRTEPKPDSTPK
ncbi:MAG: hypothetical protein ORN51_14050 [Akkermansiaceae bacterium]|nr:hypothetical protein [Akkermansiaceae bacterium]